MCAVTRVIADVLAACGRSICARVHPAASRTSIALVIGQSGCGGFRRTSAQVECLVAQCTSRQGVPKRSVRLWRAKMLPCPDLPSSALSVASRGFVAATIPQATSSSAPNARLTPRSSSRSKTASGARRAQSALQRETPTSRHTPDRRDRPIGCSRAGGCRQMPNGKYGNESALARCAQISPMTEGPPKLTP
jgi:hypothetical protein